MSTVPLSYLQVVTFLHVEVQPVLQLLQVPGFLQDTLPLAKSLQATCFAIMQNTIRDLQGPASLPPRDLPSNIGRDPVSCLTASGAPHTHHGCTSESYRCSGDGDAL